MRSYVRKQLKKALITNLTVYNKENDRHKDKD